MASPSETSNSFNCLGAGRLLRDLRAVLSTLENLNVPFAEPEVSSLIEQIGDLVDIVRSFDHLATKERRHPSLQLEHRSADGLLHLQSVLDSTAAIIDECNLFIRPLQPSLEFIAHERDAAGYITTESRLDYQAWHEETYQALRLLTEVLRTLFTAIDLLRYQHDTDKNLQSLESRSSTSTQLHFQIGLVEQKLHRDGQLDTNAVGFDPGPNAYISHLPTFSRCKMLFELLDP